MKKVKTNPLESFAAANKLSTISITQKTRNENDLAARKIKQ